MMWKLATYPSELVTIHDPVRDAIERNVSSDVYVAPVEVLAVWLTDPMSSNHAPLQKNKLYQFMKETARLSMYTYYFVYTLY